MLFISVCIIIIIVVVVVPRDFSALFLYVEGILQSVVSFRQPNSGRGFFFLFLIYTSIDHIPDPRSVSPRDGGNSSSRILHNRASSSKSGKKKKFGKFFLSLNRDNIQEIIDRDMTMYIAHIYNNNNIRKAKKNLNFFLKME